ncbi:MAG: hypothetical protein GQ545_11285 [Candidatus Aminicenantes bacterium]|nr:hypothetical protein [Candidatus Aminicenantes bacterium]
MKIAITGKGGTGKTTVAGILAHCFKGSGYDVVDMEAGIEHLGRATAQSIDRMLIVVEPGLRSIQTAHTILKMGKDIGVPSFGILAVLSRLNFKESIKPFCHRKTNQRGTLPLNIE